MVPECIMPHDIMRWILWALNDRCLPYAQLKTMTCATGVGNPSPVHVQS